MQKPQQTVKKTRKVEGYNGGRHVACCAFFFFFKKNVENITISPTISREQASPGAAAKDQTSSGCL